MKKFPELGHYLEKGLLMEVSTGLFSDDESIQGQWNDKKYIGIVRNHKPDHLALLPGGVGACSANDGCGIRINSAEEAAKAYTEKMGGLLGCAQKSAKIYVRRNHAKHEQKSHGSWAKGGGDSRDKLSSWGKDGYDAALAGKTAGDNPWPSSSSFQRSHWFQGHRIGTETGGKTREKLQKKLGSSYKPFGKNSFQYKKSGGTLSKAVITKAEKIATSLGMTKQKGESTASQYGTVRNTETWKKKGVGEMSISSFYGSTSSSNKYSIQFDLYGKQ